MHWHEIRAVCTKIACGCYALVQTRNILKSIYCALVYFALIYIYLLHCIVYWRCTYKIYIDPIKIFLKRAVRIMTQCTFTAWSKHLFFQIRILPCDQLRDLRIAECVCNVVMFSHLFPAALLHTSAHPTRNVTLGNFDLPPSSNIYGQTVLEFLGVKIWNGIPPKIKHSQNFSKELTEHYLQLNSFTWLSFSSFRHYKLQTYIFCFPSYNVPDVNLLITPSDVLLSCTILNPDVFVDFLFSLFPCTLYDKHPMFLFLYVKGTLLWHW